MVPSILNDSTTFLLDFLCPGGRKIEDKLKEFEGKFGEDFKMVLESIFDEFWFDFGAKLESKLAENCFQI